MTNFSERLDEILTRLENQVAIDVTRRVLAHKSGQSPKGSHLEAKQAITSLIKELVAEAKPEEHIDVYTYSNAKTNGDIRKIAIDQFEQNLLKALEEV